MDCNGNTRHTCNYLSFLGYQIIIINPILHETLILLSLSHIRTFPVASGCYKAAGGGRGKEMLTDHLLNSLQIL